MLSGKWPVLTKNKIIKKNNKKTTVRKHYNKSLHIINYTPLSRSHANSVRELLGAAVEECFLEVMLMTL